MAGINAANTIRRREADAEIVLISYESDHFFSRTALMYVACGQLSRECVEPYERDYYNRMNFTRVRDRVVSVDPQNKALHLESNGALSYDRLLIASGSVPIDPPWPGGDLDGVGHFVTWANMEWLIEKIPQTTRAVVVGGGLIGIETVEVLLRAGVETSFLIREDFFWPIALDEKEAGLVAEQISQHGCNTHFATEVSEIMGRDGKVIGVKTNRGDTIECDLVIVTIGVAPQTGFLQESGIQLDSRGGIVVNKELETSLSEVWAAGDCASVEWFNGVRRPEQLWYTSRDQGRIAALNMLDDNIEYRRSTFYNSAKFFDIEYTTAGLVSFRIDGERNWYRREPDSPYTQRIVYLPDKTVIGFNLLGRRWDHRILVDWIEGRRELDWVLNHLPEALFDEEFMPAFTVPSVSAGTGE